MTFLYKIFTLNCLICSILKKTTDMSSQTPQGLDLYPTIGKKEMKSIDVEYQVEVGYWAQRNHLQDYKIYVTMICMFDKDFLHTLLQHLGDNPWRTHPTNQNYRIQLLRQFDYPLGFVSLNKYSLRWLSTKSGQKIKTAQRKMSTNHQHLFIIWRQMRWCHW